MERDELIGKLQMVYIGDKRAMNELIDYYDELHNKIDKAIEYTNKTELDNYDIYIANILLDRNDYLLEILKDSDVDE